MGQHLESLYIYRCKNHCGESASGDGWKHCFNCDCMGEKKSGSGLKKRNASFLAFYDFFGHLTGQKRRRQSQKSIWNFSGRSGMRGNTIPESTGSILLEILLFLFRWDSCFRLTESRSGPVSSRLLPAVCCPFRSKRLSFF